MYCKKLSLQEIKKIELRILLVFDEFCKNNSLTYYLSGGTLLGAIRHKGFIPWDDDIDVCMPRADYEKFINIFHNKQLALKSNRLGNMSTPFTKIIDTTTIVKSHVAIGDTDTNIWIDIFPIDGLPDSMILTRWIYAKATFYRAIYVSGATKIGSGSSILRKFIKLLLKPISYICSAKYCTRAMEKIAAQYSYEKSQYVGAITWGLYGAGERMLKSEFEKAVEVEFEGHKFPAFSCWDSYLKGLYGDYMQLPPVEKRKTHDMEAYLIEE